MKTAPDLKKNTATKKKAPKTTLSEVKKKSASTLKKKAPAKKATAKTTSAKTVKKTSPQSLTAASLQSTAVRKAKPISQKTLIEEKFKRDKS